MRQGRDGGRGDKVAGHLQVVPALAAASGTTMPTGLPVLRQEGATRTKEGQGF